jgi:hypothetical protein
LWPTSAPWPGSSAKQPLSGNSAPWNSLTLPLSVILLSGVLSPAASPHFRSSSGTREAWDARFPLLAIRAHPFLPDPLRTESSPAAQLRPKNSLQTRTTQASTPLAPISGRARASPPQICAPGLPTRCESPGIRPLALSPYRCYTLRMSTSDTIFPQEAFNEARLQVVLDTLKGSH